jgi:hypothetical protein
MNYNTINSTTLEIASPGPQGAKGDTGQGATVHTLTLPGELYVINAKPRFYVTRSYQITAITASVGTAPTGDSVIIDINKNGVTIFTTQGNRPTISDGSNIDLSSTPDIDTLSAGDYLTVSIDQVGSSFAGSDLTVQIELTEV